MGDLEKDYDQLKIGKYMLRYNDSRKTNWEVCIMVLALYNSFLIPF
jgi:hypothetical protein